MEILLARTGGIVRPILGVICCCTSIHACLWARSHCTSGILSCRVVGGMLRVECSCTGVGWWVLVEWHPWFDEGPMRVWFYISFFKSTVFVRLFLKAPCSHGEGGLGDGDHWAGPVMSHGLRVEYVLASWHDDCRLGPGPGPPHQQTGHYLFYLWK